MREGVDCAYSYTLIAIEHQGESKYGYWHLGILSLFFLFPSSVVYLVWAALRSKVINERMDEKYQRNRTFLGLHIKRRGEMVQVLMLYF